MERSDSLFASTSSADDDDDDDDDDVDGMLSSVRISLTGHFF